MVTLNDYINTKQSLNGSFFLCIGSIKEESKDVYGVTYAYKDSDNVIRPQTTSVDKSKIGFIEDNQKLLEVHYKRGIYGMNNFGKWFLGSNKWSEDTKGDAEAIDYIFHVPENSIIKDIDVDLK